MDIKYSLKLLSVSILCLQLQLIAAETYRWTDSDGKLHFSDRQPVHQPAAPIEIKPIETIRINQVQPIKPIQNKRKTKIRSKKRITGKCQKVRQQILKLESSLKKRQTAKDFDIKNKQLVALRWEKIKRC